MAMREAFKANCLVPSEGTLRAIDTGYRDEAPMAQMFFAGHAAAVKEAGPLLDTLVNLGLYPALIDDYLTAIGDETL
jgi:hypothetical protein